MPRVVAAARAGAALVVGAFVLRLVAPLAQRLDRFGFHDWDSHGVYRWAAVTSLRYGEFPWWNPWQCGGFPAWGFAEGATNVVSPYLPFYLALPLQIAERVEIAGSALAVACGVYLLASRFTDSRALRALAVFVGALNGRWSLQAAVGHSWHLHYAWMPFALWALDVAIEERRPSRAILAGAALAASIYTGAVYPTPHAALALTLYALALAALRRSTYPIGQLAIAAASAFGLSAPKLFAIADTMSRVPRPMNSQESVGPAEMFRMLASRDQWFYTRPFDLGGIPWHEYGAYVGVIGVAVALGGAVLAHRTHREIALAATGVALLALGFGAFHPLAPWSLLHHVPPFSSQHVPTRFVYPALMVLSVAFAAAAGRWLRPRIARAPMLDVALLVPVAILAFDLTSIGADLFAHTFRLTMPPLPEHAEFRQSQHGTMQYVEADAVPHATLPTTMSNQGYVECYGIHPSKMENGVLVPIHASGAIGADAPGYRGEAYVAEGAGRARVVAWSPSHAEIEIADAPAGSIVAYNATFDPSWRVDGVPAFEWHGVPAARVREGQTRMEFRYRPRTLGAGLAVFAICASAIAAYAIKRRREEKAKS